MPKVSIVMSVYNSEKTLQKTIDSVLSQSYGDFEFIIINDGSVDGSEEILKKNQTKDARIVLVENKENGGLIYSLNYGLNIAKGEYVARIDSDDWWIDKDKLKKQVDFLYNNPDYVLVGTFATVFDEKGQEIYNLKYPVTDFKIRKNILIKNCFVHSSVLFAKEIAMLNGTYSQEEKYVEDYGLWLRMGRENKFHNLPFTMVGYTLNKGGETLSFNLKQIKNSLKLVIINKKYYPNFILAQIKWLIKIILINIFGVSVFIKFKNIIKK